jgi:5'(3')-deoxyribonucleotidase
MTKILYIDMDNVLVDFPSAFPLVDPTLLDQHADNKDDIPGIFSLMTPMPGAVDKLLWVKRHLGAQAYKRLILTHHKHLNAGDYLIDDRIKNGADRFGGELILFGSERFPGWTAVTAYLRESAR